MVPMTLQEIAQAVGGTLLGESDPKLTVEAVFTDSRKPVPGGLFIPLVGERFDAHAFIESALEHGAAAVLTDRERQSYLPGKGYVKVRSTQDALRDLAAHYKAKFSIPFIGITGSVGKTTTKDMVAAVLGEKFKVLKTDGNFNNEVGLPLTLFRLDPTVEICVLEMGMNHFKEIDYLASLVKPQVAVITNIGDAHIENLGSRENILRAKSEIFAHLDPDKGFVVLNGDDELLLTLRDQLPFETVYVGMEEGNRYRGTNVISDGKKQITATLQTPQGDYAVEIPALGQHMLYPTLTAAAVGAHFGMTGEEIARGVARFAPTKMRMNILKRGDNITILDDAYNANPQSMRAAAEVLGQSGPGLKIAVLGDMFELGAFASTLHLGVGEGLGRAGVDALVAIGPLAQNIYDGAERSSLPQAYWYATQEAAWDKLRELVAPNCTVLVKASRGMEFEKTVEFLKSITKEAP